MSLKRAALLAAIALWAPLVTHAQITQTIEITDVQANRLGIQTVAAAKSDTVAIVELPGRVTRPPSSLRSVSAPFSGIISDVHALAGQTVKAGDPIATIASRTFAASTSSLEQARVEAKAAAAALERQRQLLAVGLVSRASLDEAEARANRALAASREFESFRPANASSPRGSNAAYVVRAPASGRLGPVLVHVGDSIADMAPIASIAASDILWVEFQVPARLIGQIQQGDQVVFANGSQSPIISITDVIDPTTRSANATASVPNTLKVFEGQLLRAKFSRHTSGGEFVQVPASAVVQIDGTDHVFRQTTGGFAPLAVNVAGKTAEAATLTGGLRPGERVAVSGTTELKALALEGPN